MCVGELFAFFYIVGLFFVRSCFLISLETSRFRAPGLFEVLNP